MTLPRPFENSFKKKTSQGSIDRRPEPDAIEAQTKSCLPVQSIAGFEQTKKETKRFIDAQSAFGVKRAKTCKCGHFDLTFTYSNGL